MHAYSGCYLLKVRIAISHFQAKYLLTNALFFMECPLGAYQMSIARFF
jgi:hypothetical protein